MKKCFIHHRLVTWSLLPALDLPFLFIAKCHRTYQSSNCENCQMNQREQEALES